MKPSQIMSAMADAGAQRYSLLIDGWQALYTRALDAPDFGTPRQLNTLVSNAYNMAGVFLNGEDVELTDAFFQIAQQALTATNEELGVADAEALSDAVDEHLSAFVAHLYAELSLQIERDIAMLKRTLQQTILAVQLSSRAQRLPLRTALIQHRIAVNTDVNFTFQDRRSMKWPARRYIRIIWRHNLLALYNDVVLMTLADHGVDTAHVRHDDVTSALHGTEIAISPNTNLPTLADIRNEAFHPNADAVVARYA